MNRDFKGIWIPKEIWLMRGLSSLSKILWSEIDSLYSEEHGGCYASNEYLANFAGVKERRLKEILAELKAKGLLEQVSFDGRVRIIKALHPPKDGAPLPCGKAHGGGAEKCTGGVQKNAPLTQGTIPYREQSRDISIEKEKTIKKESCRARTSDDQSAPPPDGGAAPPDCVGPPPSVCFSSAKKPSVQRKGRNTPSEPQKKKAVPTHTFGPVKLLEGELEALEAKHGKQCVHEIIEMMKNAIESGSYRKKISKYKAAIENWIGQDWNKSKSKFWRAKEQEAQENVDYAESYREAGWKNVIYIEDDEVADD